MHGHIGTDDIVGKCPQNLNLIYTGRRMGCVSNTFEINEL